MSESDIAAALAAPNVDAFDVPANRSGCTTSGKRGESFDMNVTFAATDAVNGEFRQYVKGSFKKKAPSDADWVTLTHLLFHNVALDASTYHEDGIGNGAYGYRAFNGCSDNFYTDATYTTVNRAAGRYYHGQDFPGMNGFASGTQYQITLDFKGDAVDATNGTVLRTNSWTVNCGGTF